jgi:putative FmdB family regulatory protein
MPIYKYKCEKCGSHIEVIQKINDAPLKRCVKCRGKLEKVVSRTSFQLKGSGWYATDYPHKDAQAGKDKDVQAGKDKDAQAGKDKKGKGADKKSENVSTTTASGEKD